MISNVDHISMDFTVYYVYCLVKGYNFYKSIDS